MPARELGRALPGGRGAVAGELGCERELEYVALMLDQGSGADLQRRVHAAGGMPELLDFLVDETARLH